MGGKKWDVLVLGLSKKEHALVQNVVDGLKETANLTPVILECSDDEATPPYQAFLNRLRNAKEHVLVIVGDASGSDERPQYVLGGSKPASQAKTRPETARSVGLEAKYLAEELLPMSQRQEKFQVVILAGEGTASIGKCIDAKLSELPLLQPPAVICWERAENANKTEGVSANAKIEFTVKFLENTLKARSAASQNKLDLRGTMHSFVAEKRKQIAAEKNSEKEKGKQSASEKRDQIAFFPRSQVDYIEHIYFRLGLSAFELGRRIVQILNNGFLPDFAARDNNQDDGPYKTYAVHSTIFLFAELFAWLHILRQQAAGLYYHPCIRNLEYAFSGDTVSALTIQAKVDETGKDKWKLGDLTKPRHSVGIFRLLKFDQRSIGEVMVTEDGDRHEVVNWVKFENIIGEHVAKDGVFEKLEKDVLRLVCRGKTEDRRDATEGRRDETGEVAYVAYEQKPGVTKYVLSSTARVRLAWIYNQLFNVVLEYAPDLNSQSKSQHLKRILLTADAHIPQEQKLAKLRTASQANGKGTQKSCRLKSLDPMLLVLGLTCGALATRAFVSLSTVL